MQFFDGPAFADKAVGKIIEQFRMRGPVALRAEVAGRADQSVPEMLLPDAIDDHPGSERIVGAGDGFSEFETLLAAVEALRFRGREDSQKTRWRKLSAVVLIAANPDMLLLRLLFIGDDLHYRIRGWKILFEVRQLGAQPGKVIEPDARQEAVDLFFRFTKMKNAAIAQHVFPQSELGAIERNEIRFGEVLTARIEAQANMVFVVDASLLGDHGEDLRLKFRSRFRALIRG